MAAEAVPQTVTAKSQTLADLAKLNELLNETIATNSKLSKFFDELQLDNRHTRVFNADFGTYERLYTIEVRGMQAAIKALQSHPKSAEFDTMSRLAFVGILHAQCEPPPPNPLP